jgi:hypothetical protein
MWIDASNIKEHDYCILVHKSKIVTKGSIFPLVPLKLSFPNEHSN